MIEFLNDFWTFMKVRKKYWMLPILLGFLFLGGVIILGQGAVVAPFIYALF